LGKYESHLLWYRQREVIGVEFRRTELELWRNSYSLFSNHYINEVPAAIQSDTGRDPRDPNRVDAGSWRAAAGLVEWRNEYRHQAEHLRQHPSLVLRQLWTHNRQLRVHVFIPVIASLGVFLLSLTSRRARAAAAWWVALPRRAAVALLTRRGGDRRHGFEVVRQ
jgi:hypothetical protein